MEKYVPFNYFTFQNEENYDCKQYRLSGEYTQEELEAVDDTIEVVNKIVDLINYCGAILEKDETKMRDYDEAGNYNSEDGDEETTILLASFPGVFVPKDYLFQNLSIIKKGADANNGIAEHTVQNLLASSLPGKCPVKIIVSPKTFFEHRYEKIGVDQTIEGIVNFNLLCTLLRENGIDMSITTINGNDFRDRMTVKIKEFSNICGGDDDSFFAMLNEWEASYLTPDIDYPTEEVLLDTLSRTRMESSMNISVPLSTYLKEFKGKANNKN